MDRELKRDRPRWRVRLMCDDGSMDEQLLYADNAEHAVKKATDRYAGTASVTGGTAELAKDGES